MIARKYTKFLSCFLASVVIVSHFSISAYADETASKSLSSGSTETYSTQFSANKYSSFLKNNKLQEYSGQAITYKAGSIVDGEGQQKDDVRIITGDEVTFSINAPEEKLYYIGFHYFSEGDSILPIEASIKVNEVYPFDELKRVLFESKWTTPTEEPTDRYGNEVVPEAEKAKEWQDKYIMDSSYRGSDPLAIPLKKGENKLTVKIEEGDMKIDSISLNPSEELKKYTAQAVEGNGFIQIEAEDLTYRNDSSIRPLAEYNTDVTPYNSSKKVLNILDAASFKRAGQRVEYEVNVDKAGYYNLGFRYRQNAKVDFPVFANISVDGKVPFEQLKNYTFDYTTKFKNITLEEKASNESIGIYLEEGKHTVGITISIDPLKETVEAIDTIMSEIEALTLQIINMTGSSKDKYRDFELEKYIPGVEEKLTGWADRLDTIYKNMQVYSPDVRKIGAFSELKIAEEQLRSLAEESEDLPRRISELSRGRNSVTIILSNLQQSIGNNGLALDKIFIYQNENSLPKGVNFFVKLWESIKRFVISFTKQDYATNNVDEKNLQVWVNRPRQYIEILQRMIDSEFTPKTGIKVDLSIMPDQNKLTLANAAGKAPDVATAINYALPSDLALRGALQDLTEFKDFNEIKDRFPQGLLVPSMIGDSVYSVPETLNFWVLYYRRDILQSLNIPVPNTMEDVKKILPELQRKGMNFYYPTAGMVGTKVFAGTMPLIYQNGGSFYGDTLGKTTLTSEESINGIRELTELFTIYNIPRDVPSFYQSFRDGSLPIGIAEYGMYNLLVNAAPEIASSWEIALVPGVENEKGEVQRWTAGGAENCIIFKDSDKKDEAWEYLKWWTDKTTQAKFGNTLQTTYGKEYIWNSANTEAFKELPWSTKNKKVILEQTKWMIEPPRVPGSYMLERELSNAYVSIVEQGKNLRNAVDLAAKRIDRETNRKLEEFGYSKDGKVIKPYEVPKID
jgi:ABC-type glycerol-3-phosphate transport system substrate-binding protein